MLPDPKAMLESLGHTPKDIAQNLKALGIKGFRGSNQHCPLACFLKRDEHLQDIYVEWSIVVFGYATDPERYTVHLPPACQIFVTLFDEGKYPELFM